MILSPNGLEFVRLLNMGIPPGARDSRYRARLLQNPQVTGDGDTVGTVE